MKIKKSLPYEFVLEQLADLDVETRAMFGCTAIYVGEKIVLVLRQKGDHRADNGVWLATSHEHHESLRREEFPAMRSISFLGQSPTNWQVLPEDDADFEAAALRACELVRERDPRIGHVPKRKRPKKRAAPRRAARPRGTSPRKSPRS